MARKKNDRKGCIFTFHDGIKDRKIDTMKTFLEFNTIIPVEVMANMDEKNPECVQKLIGATRKVLTLPDFSEENETALTDMEVMTVLNEFLELVDGLKKDTSPNQTSQNNMVPQS